MECRLSAFSRVGGREHNEDACGYLETAGVACCVLADGAGGHGGGDIASRLSVQSVLNDFMADPEVSASALDALMHNANQSVLVEQQRDPSVGNMQSTLVVLLFDPRVRRAIWGHVGDSRLYLLRNGIGFLRTRDHSLVQSMVDSGILSEEEAHVHKERNVLVASVGSPEAFTPTIIDTPFPLIEGDAFLLCSDGFWGLIDDEAIERCLAASESPDDWLNHMDQLISPQIQSGSDNYSAIGVWCGEVDGMRTIPRPD